MPKASFQGTGRVRWKLLTRDGEILQEGSQDNVRILAWRAKMAEILQEGNANQNVGIATVHTGTGLTAPVQTDTDMETELDSGTGTWVNTNLVNDPPECTVYYQFQPGEANGDNTEAGLFDADDDMVAHSRYASGDITGATAADPVVITSVAHGRTDADKVRIQDVVGMTELNGNDYFCDVLTVDTMALYSDAALTTSVDGSGYTAYSSGGEWVLKVVKTSSEILQTSWDLTW